MEQYAQPSAQQKVSEYLANQTYYLAKAWIRAKCSGAPTLFLLDLGEPSAEDSD